MKLGTGRIGLIALAVFALSGCASSARYSDSVNHEKPQRMPSSDDSCDGPPRCAVGDSYSGGKDRPANREYACVETIYVCESGQQISCTDLNGKQSSYEGPDYVAHTKSCD